jgi:Family of unknown function (DUF6460)
MNTLFGGRPLGVLFRLIVLSVIVGVVLALLGLSPYQLVDSVRVAALRLYQMGFDAFGWLFQYFLLGAVIVVPLWLISRFWSLLTRGDNR